MSERKVLNKYYPPDFDITKLPKLHLSRDRQFVIRIMAPFSMRCKTCGEYIYKGRKFNARQETVKDETYLGLRIFRFYIRCPKCVSEITFKTDPENTDYQMEEGATRNFQARKLAQEEDERLRKEKEDEELNNPMKALENRTKESKQEMDLLEKLEELKDLNQRHAKVDHEMLLKDNWKTVEEAIAKQEEEDEALVRSIFQKQSASQPKRLTENDSDDEDVATNVAGPSNVTDILTSEPLPDLSKPPQSDTSKKSSSAPFKNKTQEGKVTFGKKLSGLVVVKKKRPMVAPKEPESTESKVPKIETVSVSENSAENEKDSLTSSSLGLLCGYDSSSSGGTSD